MSVQMSPDEVRRALIAQGVPAERAARAVAHLDPSADVAAALAHPKREVGLPFRFTLPWSALCSDNSHEKASLVQLGGGNVVPRKVMHPKYRAAREKTQEIVRRLAGDAAPRAEPLAIRALVYVPDEHPHDVCNFAKCCHDALEGILYANDRWLYRTTWERAGVDVDQPRAEIELIPLVSR